MEEDPEKGKLREQAKRRLDNRGPAPKRPASTSIELFEELTIHEEELNIQNEELRRVQIELEATKAEYFELYDLAPVGYITLSNDLIIQKSNLAASTIFDIERNELINKGISRFVSPGNHESLILHYHRLAQGHRKQVSTFLVRGQNGKELHVQFESNLVEYGPEKGFRSVLTDVTELKKTKDALTEGEIKYRSLFDSIDEGFCTIEVLFDKKGSPIDYRFLEINAAFERQTGIHDAVGKRMREIEPRHEEHWFQIYGAIAKTGESKRFTLEAKALIDGWYDVYAFKIGGGDSNKVAIIFNDITERKMAEASLKKANEELDQKVRERTRDLVGSEERYQRLFSSIQSPISIYKFIYDDRGDIVHWTLEDTNPAGLKLLGNRSLEEVRGKNETELYGPNNFSDRLPSLMKLKSHGGQIVSEMYFDWSKRYVISSLVLIDTDHFISSVTDITDFKKAQAETEESEARYRSLFENNQAPMLIIDPTTGEILDANQIASKYYGYSHEKLTKMKIDQINTLDPEVVKVEMAQSLDGSKRKFDFRHRLANGENRDVEVYSGVIHVQGRPLLYSIIHDITERKEIEREVVKRTNDLARSNLELQQFAYVASHDLQEPLRMVTAYLGLLEKKYGDQLDGKAKEYMDIAIDGGMRARNLIQDLLEFSRVGSQAKDLRKTNMEEVLAKALENLLIQIGEENALVTHDPLPTILADDSQMLQVMQNLIGNAIKFHGTEPPVVHISYKDNGTERCFSVSDNGIGIDPQYKDKIFVLFQRLHARNEYEGTGIGLAICKKIVELHGGTIWFESRPGSGTTFYFTVSKELGKWTRNN